MSNVPDGLSEEALKALHEQAPSDEEQVDKTVKDNKKKNKKTGPYDGLTKKQMLKLVAKTKDNILDKCADPMVHKMLALAIIADLGTWHQNSAEQYFKDDDSNCLGWSHDAMALKIAYRILYNVSLGPDDFTND